MTNKEIANAFSLLADLMELHSEEAYKIKSYSFAYRVLRNEEKPLAEMNLTELKSIKGVGDAIANKILELQKNGSMRILNEYLEKTPAGVVQLLDVKGMGVKKVYMLWKELEIESPGELLYACNENRLAEMKGFGTKSQQNIKEQLEYHFQSQEKYRWASVEEDADNLLDDFSDVFKGKFLLSGAFLNLEPVVDCLEYVVEAENFDELKRADLLEETRVENDLYEGRLKKSAVKIKIHRADLGFSAIKSIEISAAPSLYDFLRSKISDFKGLQDAEIFEAAGLTEIPFELRDIDGIEKMNDLPNLVKTSDIKGVLHVHSTYSDGASGIKEMADYCRAEGYSYLGISDHSQSAFYANGLKPERVLQQWEEIEKLNKAYSDFYIFKGIESDIKFDGELDYQEELLKGFDFVIASIHSNLKMNEEKATSRLIKAIENPYTTILGHPTGRLLLARPGYPIDHKKVIDAAAANKVIIEINANPLRLDLDYRWISYALEKDVKIAINPDAHSKAGVHDIRYGVQVARKGLLGPENCVNCLSREEFARLIAK
jgi:DNA polymerase (family X)